ncbi:hypothetical protein V2J09_004238, partial [Rumex salicifolius]
NRSRIDIKSRRKGCCQVEGTAQALQVWREPGGPEALIKEIIKEGVGDPFSLEEDDVGVGKKVNLGELNRRQCMRNVSDGHFTIAVRVLTSSGKKHPHVACPIVPPFKAKVEAISSSKKVVLSRIKSFPKGKSCGRDRLLAQHLVDVLGKAVVVVFDDLVTSITVVVNLLLAGKCPSTLGEFIASAPLTPLLKPGGGIRPIVVGDGCCYRGWKEVGQYPKDFQFRVGASNGGEANHAVNRLIEAKRECTQHTGVLCFVSSKVVVPHSLLKWNSLIRAPRGVQQGDPLGLVLFALTLHPLVHRINEVCNLYFMAWYLDDGTIIGDTEVVSDALHLIIKEGPSMGLHLNVEKTEIF